MTEAEWLACNNPHQMLAFLRGRVSDRKLRLYAVACCRRIAHMITDVRCARALDVAERFAEGLASDQERATAWEDAYSVVRDVRPVSLANLAAERVLLRKSGERSWAHSASHTLLTIRQASSHLDEAAAQWALLGCIFGPLPLRVTELHPSWITPTVANLAQTIYDDRACKQMPILAGALEDAGCTNPDILNHCRQPSVHVRGCWVVDLILGKE